MASETNRNITTYPCAKINLGLNITEKRTDGYHNLETVFYPVPLFDKIEISEVKEKAGCEIKVTGITIGGRAQDNIVAKAYNALTELYDLPGVKICLEKNIPTQAGMGGGSADCAFTLKALNLMFNIGLKEEELCNIAARIGADCPFFIFPTPSYATGIGEILSPINLDLSDYWIVIVKCDIAVSTREAFAGITPHEPAYNCKDIVLNHTTGEWKARLTNDFENSIFKSYPVLRSIKEKLYDIGAVYASMSGSGSAMFGIFKEKPEEKAINSIKDELSCNTYTLKLQSLTDNANELLPVVNEDGTTTGQTTRAAAHNGSKILHPVVHLHVFDNDGNIYLQKRPIWKDIQPGKWDTAVGGHVGYGESIIKALEREAAEELGIKDFKPKQIGRYIFESSSEKEFVNVFTTVYNGAISPSDKELDGGKFISKQEILSMIGHGILTPNFEKEYKRFFT